MTTSTPSEERPMTEDEYVAMFLAQAEGFQEQARKINWHPAFVALADTRRVEFVHLDVALGLACLEVLNTIVQSSTADHPRMYAELYERFEQTASNNPDALERLYAARIRYLRAAQEHHKKFRRLWDALTDTLARQQPSSAGTHS